MTDNTELLARLDAIPKAFTNNQLAKDAAAAIRDLQGQLSAALADVSGRSELLLIMQDKYEAERKAREKWHQVCKEICEEWNEDCDPACDSISHTETCKAVFIAQAKRALLKRAEAAEAKLTRAEQEEAGLAEDIERLCAEAEAREATLAKANDSIHRYAKVTAKQEERESALEAKLATVFEDTREQCVSICRELNDQSEVGDYFDMAIASMRAIKPTAAAQELPVSDQSPGRDAPATSMGPEIQQPAPAAAPDEQPRFNPNEATAYAKEMGLRTDFPEAERDEALILHGMEIAAELVQYFAYNPAGVIRAEIAKRAK